MLCQYATWQANAGTPPNLTWIYHPHSCRPGNTGQVFIALPVSPGHLFVLSASNIFFKLPGKASQLPLEMLNRTSIPCILPYVPQLKRRDRPVTGSMTISVKGKT